MKGRFTGLYLILFLLVNLCICTSANAAELFAIKNILPDRSGNLVAVTGTGNLDSEIKISRLSNPDRLIVDVGNSILIGQKQSINLNNKNITNLRIAQFSTEPKTVRLVFTADSAQDLKNIKINRNKNIILFLLKEPDEIKAAENPLYKDKDMPSESTTLDKISTETVSVNNSNDVIIDNTALSDKDVILKNLQSRIDHNIVLKVLKHSDNRLIISGTGIISLTEPVILENPKRLVFDIPDGVVSSEDLLTPITFKNGDVIRLGQFDKNTVRVVVETKQPDSYKTLISPDMQSLIISPDKEISFQEFPDSSSNGRLQDIKIIKKDAMTTYFLLTSEKPIIHDLKRINAPDNKLIIDLYNVKQPVRNIVQNLEQTGQFHGVFIENISKFSTGSKLTVPLNKTTRIESKLSLDGRLLEVTLKDVMPVPAVVINKHKLKGKIVLDAGHGGQEPGAMRAGIYEKNITIVIIHKIENYLEQAGYSVVMTREADETVSLKQRVEITNAENPDLFASVHVNSSENPNLTGLETYYYTPQSKALAQSVHAKMISYIKSRDNGIRTARFYVIRNTEVPAILAEIGYLSNDAERADILTEERMNTTAKAIADGIINFLKSSN